MVAMLSWSRLAFCNDAAEMFLAIRTGDLEKVRALIKDNPEAGFRRCHGLAASAWGSILWLSEHRGSAPGAPRLHQCGGAWLYALTLRGVR
jgi:hypothetical protein